MKDNLSIGSVPLWAWVIVGWLGAGTVASFWNRGALERAMVDAPVVKEIEWELEAMSARELRTLPGIGKTRAVDLAKARWAAPKDVAFDMRVVPGIGDVTARRTREFLLERRSGEVPIPPPGWPRKKRIEVPDAGGLRR